MCRSWSGAGAFSPQAEQNTATANTAQIPAGFEKRIPDSSLSGGGARAGQPSLFFGHEILRHQRHSRIKTGLAFFPDVSAKIEYPSEQMFLQKIVLNDPAFLHLGRKTPIHGVNFYTAQKLHELHLHPDVIRVL